MAARSVSRVALLTLATALTVGFAVLAWEVADGAVVTVSAPWVPILGLHLALRFDGLSIVLALLVSGIGALVAAYAASYVTDAPGRLYLHLTTFMLAMIGLVLADDLLLLYVFWELTSITSFFLVGFHHERPEARAAARQTLLVTVFGGLCLFAGLILLRIAGQSSSITTLLDRADAIRAHALYLPILLLVGIGAFTKSAQVPFHSWLPRAMEAPTPASAYLHAATMVKAGVYVLARFSPILAGTAAWTALIVPVGLVTMVVGAARAFGETKLKRILAYSTVSALGLLTAMLGVGTTEAVLAALTYLVAHALYKGALFLAAGAIERGADVKDVRRLGGVLRVMPRVAVVVLAAALSMAGVPPFLGFLGKDLAYAALWPAGLAEWGQAVALAAVFASSALFVAVALELTYVPLRGPPAPTGARDPSPWLWAPPLVLGVLGLVAGLAPGTLAPLLVQAASEVAPSPPDPEKLALKDITKEAVLSAVTLLAGVGAYAARRPLRCAGGALARTLRLSPSGGYELAMRVLAAVASWQTRVLQNGYLRFYVLTTIGATSALILVGLVAGGEPRASFTITDLRWGDAALTGVILAAALVAVAVESRFAAIAAMGVVGFGVALVFLELGAPDLAMTQFVVDVLLVVFFVAAFHYAPQLVRLSSPRARVRDAVVSGAFGLLMGALALVAAGTEPAVRVSDWALRESLPSGHGRNVVNVILTDFRSVDTLGEITVLATAAFGVVALLRLRDEDGR